MYFKKLIVGLFMFFFSIFVFFCINIIIDIYLGLYIENTVYEIFYYMHPVYTGVSETVDYVDYVISIPYENNGRIVKNYRFLYDDLGRTCYIFVEWKDISASVTEERNLRKKQEKYNTLYDLCLVVLIGGGIILLIKLVNS